MTTQEARKHFDEARDRAIAAGNKDSAANIELAREYFCNPEFRRALADHVWALNQAEGR